MTPLLQITGLQVEIGDGKGRVNVLRGVDLQVSRGEIVGLVGESGSGKTTTMLAAAGLLSRTARITAGSIQLAGESMIGLSPRQWRTVRGRKIACVFQNGRNSLHPMMTVGEQIARFHELYWGSSSKMALRETVATLEHAGLGNASEMAGRYPHELSGGQCQRAMIAMALIGRPEIVLADEPTSGLDVSVQQQVLTTLMEVVREDSTALVLVSHDIAVVQRMCDRVNVMYGGEIVESGDRAAVLSSPEHPYTQGLLAARVPHDKRMNYIPGQVLDLRHVIVGCAFADRCGLADDACRKSRPANVSAGPDHLVRCIHHGQSSSSISSTEEVPC